MATWQEAYEWSLDPTRKDPELMTAARGLRLPGPMTRGEILDRIQVAYDAEPDKNVDSPWGVSIKPVKPISPVKPTVPKKPAVKGWKCSNGHNNPSTAKFCGICGKTKSGTSPKPVRNAWSELVDGFLGRKN